MHTHSGACICMQKAHAHALIRLHSLAFACILTHSYACICILRKAPAQGQPLLWRGLALLEGLHLTPPQDYKLTLQGEEPKHYTAYKEADSGSKEELEALCDVCQSMHMVMSLGKGFPPGSFISSELNPAELICTCKGYKISSNCSHTVAVTALFITAPCATILGTGCSAE